MISALLVSALLGAVPRPTPEQLALPGYRVHVLASEDLEPDRLRSLARDGVVLWLRTRTNLLRASTLETVAQFSQAWVELRPPITEVEARQLARAPSVGVWTDARHLRGVGWHRLGPRPLALRVAGPLVPSLAGQLAAARPRWIEWDPGGTLPDLLGWGELEQLSGTKVVDVGALGGMAALSSTCAAGPSGRLAAGSRIQLRVQPGGEAIALRCGVGVRVRVSPRVTERELRAIHLAHPAAELEVDVGQDEATAFAARGLLGRLEAGSVSRGRAR